MFRTLHFNEEEKNKTKTHCNPLKVFVYPLKVIGAGVHENVPDVHGFPVVVSPSTTLQLSS